MAKILDPSGKIIKTVLNRKNCIRRDNFHIKDLRILQGRELKDIIIVDNLIENFVGQMENGIYVPTFTGHVVDTELVTIMNFLKSIAGVSDVRPYVKYFAGIVRLYDKYKNLNFIPFTNN